MPRRKRPEPPKPWWIVHLMHSSRAERLGIVRARDEAEAIDRAADEFKLTDQKRRRVLARREAD